MKYNIDITELWEHNYCNINTPDGYQKINQLVKKYNKVCYALLFDNGDIIECSEDHLIQKDNLEWIKAKDLKQYDKILCESGVCLFLSKYNLGINDVYDLEVNHNNHRYYSESIVSHNTGKSSTAHAIIKELNCEALWINGSLENGIDVLRGKLQKFASASSFDDKIKIVVIDEFDYFTQAGMAAFRGFIDEFSSNCRFIFTGNYPEKIIQPLLDRLQVYDFNNFSKQDMVKPIFERLKFILDNESISYDPKTLVPVINTFYPSIRSMVGALQKHSSNNEFSVTESELDGLDVFDKIMLLIKAGNFEEMIKSVNDLNAPNNFYTFLYKEINKYYKEKQPQVILTLAKYQNMSTSVRDITLNLAACCTELIQIKG